MSYESVEVNVKDIKDSHHIMMIIMTNSETTGYHALRSLSVVRYRQYISFA